jgi:hypothetical protein
MLSVPTVKKSATSIEQPYIGTGRGLGVMPARDLDLQVFYDLVHLQSKTVAVTIFESMILLGNIR